MTVGEAVRQRIIQLCQERDISINKLSSISGVTQLQISPERCDDFALGGVSLSVPAVWSFRMNGAFRLWV